MNLTVSYLINRNNGDGSQLLLIIGLDIIKSDALLESTTFFSLREPGFSFSPKFLWRIQQLKLKPFLL